MIIHKGYELQELNTFSMKCKASYYIEVECVDDAVKLSQDEFFRTLPMMIKGGGSNLLFVGDFKGAVLHYSGSSVSIVNENDSETIVRVEAGKEWHQLVMEMASKGLWGLENLALIPGEVGASAVQNIGAYGAEAKDVIVAVHAIDLLDGTIKIWENDHCDYAYRHSIFKEKALQFQLIYAVDFKLSKIPCPNLRYAGLSSMKGVEDPTPIQIAEEVINIRQNKLPDPAKLPNAGSFFMNPIVTKEVFTQLICKYPEIPHYALPNEKYKIPAAWLIEQAGLKGTKDGNVGTYTKQPLVVVNYGGALGHEVVDFSHLIIDKVYKQFGIELHPEVRFIRSGEADCIGNYIE